MIEFFVIATSILLVLLVASVLIPWACEHDGESWREIVKSTFNKK